MNLPTTVRRAAPRRPGRRILVALLAAGALLSIATPARASTAPVPPPDPRAVPAASGTSVVHSSSAAAPSGYISPNVEFIANIPAMLTAISIAFIDTTMFVSTVHGLYSYDITDITNPTLLGAAPQYIWENENMAVDPARHLLFLSRDPRGFTSPGTTAFPYGAIQTYDVSNPAVFKLLSVITLPVGHTTSCVVADCTWVWTGGPAKGQGQPADWEGRPIFATDMHDPANPVMCPDPVDVGAHDGVTTYSHGVEVDPNGVVWVSGIGHVRGYWVTGTHYDALTGTTRAATPCKPVPYAGGGTSEGADLAAGAIMHNSWHDPTLSVDGRQGDVLATTEENTVTDCTQSGRFITYDIGNTYNGAGYVGIDKSHFRMTKLDQWTPEKKPGSTGCDSAHWFTDRGDGIIAIAFYSQGTRFLDIRNPRHIQQVGWYNITGVNGSTQGGTNTWAAYWRPNNYVVVADFGRGVDILRYHDVSTPPTGAVGAPRASAPSGYAQAAVASLPNTGLAGAGAIPALLASALVLGAARRRRDRGEGGA